jgi:hypothetical protein
MVLNVLAFTLLVAIDGVHAFLPPLRWPMVSSPSPTSSFSLNAMKKRKRKQLPRNSEGETSSTIPPLSSREQVDNPTEDGTFTDDELALMKDIVNFEFKPEALTSIGMYYALCLLDKIFSREAHLH